MFLLIYQKVKKIIIILIFKSNAIKGNIQNLQDNRFDGENGRFIQCVSEQTLVALWYHKTKNHAAIVEVHNGFTSLFGAQDKIHRSSRGQAPPGQWACAYTMSGRLGGDKARFEYY